jgi:hypothetical protein
MRAPPSWIAGWLRDRVRKAALPRLRGERHLLFAVCDHFEPLHGRAPRDVGLARVRAWREALPELARRFRDATGRSPRHTFFYPGEEYDPALVEPLAELVNASLGEIEVHLHHDGDTRATLREKLERTLKALDSHGVVSKCGARPAWSFIHGNWSLANGRHDGRWCGVDDELCLLHELGCYADFTFPSAPDPCQPVVVNAIYYPRDASRRRAYDDPEHVRVGSPKRRGVLLVQGPLAIAWRPTASSACSSEARVRTINLASACSSEARVRTPLRIEAAALSSSDPPNGARLATWIAQWVHVEGRPEWTFVKVHGHGAPEKNARVMLGEPMARLHEALAALGSQRRWRVHYVSAREMYNVARAAMDGRQGSPAEYFDYEIRPPERARYP